MAPLTLNHGLEPRPEGTAAVDDVALWQGRPLPLNKGLQVVDTLVGDSADLGLKIAPDAKVQEHTVLGQQGPEVVGPEVGQLLLAPLLDDLGLVAWCAILLSAKVALGVCGIQPWLDNILHDLQALLGPHHEALQEPERRSPIAV